MSLQNIENKRIKSGSCNTNKLLKASLGFTTTDVMVVSESTLKYVMVGKGYNIRYTMKAGSGFTTTDVIVVSESTNKYVMVGKYAKSDLESATKVVKASSRSKTVVS